MTRVVACHYRLGQPVEAGRVDISSTLDGLGQEELDAPSFGRCVARFYNAKAITLMESGRLQAARELYDSALRSVRAARDAFGTAVVETNIGNVLLYGEDHEGAISHYLRALRIAEKTGYAYGKAIASNNLGEVYLLTGELERAEKMLDAALKVSSALALVALLPDTLRLQAEVCLARGDEHEAALRKCDDAYRLAQKANDRPSQAMVLLTRGKALARAAASTGDADRREEALRDLQEAAEAAREGGLQRGIQEIERELNELRRLDSG